MWKVCYLLWCLDHCKSALASVYAHVVWSVDRFSRVQVLTKWRSSVKYAKVFFKLRKKFPSKQHLYVSFTFLYVHVYKYRRTRNVCSWKFHDFAIWCNMWLFRELKFRGFGESFDTCCRGSSWQQSNPDRTAETRTIKDGTIDTRRLCYHVATHEPIVYEYYHIRSRQASQLTDQSLLSVCIVPCI